MEINDLLALRGAMNDNNHFGCGCYDQCGTYESFKIADKMSKRPSTVGITGLTLGSVGLVAALGAWFFANSRSNSSEKYFNAYAHEHGRNLDYLATLLAAERSERIGGDVNIVQNARPTANAESNAFANATSQIITDTLTGRLAACPQKVSLYSSPAPCSCPASNCGGCGCGM